MSEGPACFQTITRLTTVKWGGTEWLKALRKWRIVFVVGPVVLGGLATWPLLKE
jgi:hypothetical protein